MRVLVIHNHYRFAGGEDRVVEAETGLLRDHGHEVTLYTATNAEVTEIGPLRLAGSTLWNGRAFCAVQRQIRAERPDIVHVHNTVPLLSPAVYHAASALDVPVVHTLHNYRVLCPAATLFRNGRVCEDCVGWPVALPAVAHGCYRGSRIASAAIAASVGLHRVLRTWSRGIDLYIALTDFARRKFIEGGLPADLIMVKPNFIAPDPGPRAGLGDYALFVGRLSPEKGVDTLLRAWALLGTSVPLKIVGDGPLADHVRDAASRHSGIEWLGWLQPDVVLQLMKKAWALVMPSEWYEGGLPLTVLEAFAAGLPVIASRLGCMAELVEPSRTGLLFRTGDPLDLVRTVQRGREAPALMVDLGREARREYLERYSPAVAYPALVRAYDTALDTRNRRRAAARATERKGHGDNAAAPAR